MSIKLEDMSPVMREKALKALEREDRKEAKRLREKRMEEDRKSFNKYKNIRCTRGDIKFDSVSEANRYDELVLLLKAGEIRDLKLQHNMTLVEGYKDITGKTVRPMQYRADFTYYKRDLLGNWVWIVEDVKGHLTKEYLIKKKLVKDKFGIDISEYRL